MANFVSYTNATELMTEIGNRLKALNSAYVPRGNSTFANLPTTLTKAMGGYVYNVTDEFTTTALFAEGAGRKYSAGTNVVIVNQGDDTTPDMKYDVIASFVNVDALNAEIEKVSDMITTEEFDSTAAYAIGDIVKYENRLYRFTSAHSAGEWNSAEVELAAILDMIADAEPDSLTAAQITALTALLD
jgi:hypothetical protein